MLQESLNEAARKALHALRDESAAKEPAISQIFVPSLAVRTGAPELPAVPLQTRDYIREHLLERFLLADSSSPEGACRLCDYVGSLIEGYRRPENQVLCRWLEERLAENRQGRQGARLRWDGHCFSSAEDYLARLSGLIARAAGPYADRTVHCSSASSDSPVRFLSIVPSVVDLPPHFTRFFVIGDLHGDLTALRSAFATIAADPRFQEPDSCLVFLGDLMHNGLRSLPTLFEALEIKAALGEKCVLLAGNHDLPETFGTAIREFLDVHLENTLRMPLEGKTPPVHYMHGQLEALITLGPLHAQGFTEVCRDLFAALPLVARSRHGVLFSHSFDFANPRALEELPTHKVAAFRALDGVGYEHWKRQCKDGEGRLLHSLIDVDQYESGYPAGVDLMVLGHEHARSGHLLTGGGKRVLHLCTTHEGSPDAGHYIGYEAARRRNGTHDRRAPFTTCGSYYAVVDARGSSPDYTLCPVRIG